MRAVLHRWLQGSARLRDVEFAALDTETSSWDPDHGHVVQVAVVGCRGDGTIIDRWVSYVRPPDGNVGPTEVHGIGFDDVVHAPTFEEVLPELVARLRGRIRVAHNLPFDAAMLDAAFARAGYVPGATADLDTLALSANGDSLRGHGLKDLCDRHGVPLDGWHDALVDAEAVARLLPHLFAERGLRRLRHLVRAVPGVTRPRSWPAPAFSDEVVARVAAERAVPDDLLRQRGIQAAAEERQRVEEMLRDRASRPRFRRGEDGQWCVIGPPDTVRVGPLELVSRRGPVTVEVLGVATLPDEAGVAQVLATIAPLSEPA